MIHFKNEMKLLNGPRAVPGTAGAAGRAASGINAGAPLRFWNVASTSEDEGEITLYGDIMPETPRDWWTDEPLEGRWVTPEGFDEALAAVRGKKNVTVRINSLGGDVYTGIAIHDALKDLKARVTVVVEGIAASAASVIAMAGDEIRVHPGDTIMIHGVSALLWDYYGLEDLRKIVRSFDAAEKAIARIYAEKTGLTEERLRDMMSRETWMVGKDAVEMGFADTLIGEEGPGLVASADRRVLLVAGVRHDVAGLHLPGWIRSSDEVIPDNDNVGVADRKRGDTARDNRIQTGEVPGGNIFSEEETDNMTLEELRAQQPDLVAQIEAAAAENARTSAVSEERARLQAIEEIENTIGDAALIRDAKYGENPMTAEQLALAALRQQARLGASVAAALDEDTRTANTADVGVEGKAGDREQADESPEAKRRAGAEMAKAALGKKTEN